MIISQKSLPCLYSPLPENLVAYDAAAMLICQELELEPEEGGGQSQSPQQAGTETWELIFSFLFKLKTLLCGIALWSIWIERND